MVCIISQIVSCISQVTTPTSSAVTVPPPRPGGLSLGYRERGQGTGSLQAVNGKPRPQKTLVLVASTISPSLAFVEGQSVQRDTTATVEEVGVFTWETIFHKPLCFRKQP